MTNNQLNINNLRIALIISALIACMLFIASWSLGRVGSFILLNTNLGLWADTTFKIASWAGEGWLFIPVLVYFIICKRKYIPLLLAIFILDVVIPQIFKMWIMPNQPRPTAVIADMSLIHLVHGVETHKTHSFPSGHTTIAFSLFFIACLMIKKKVIIPIGLLFALLVAYSRVYLAQHFPIDLAGGIVSAIIAVMLPVWVQKQFSRDKGIAS